MAVRSTASPHAARAAAPSATLAVAQLEQLVEEACDHRPLGHFRQPLTPFEKVPSEHGMHNIVLATLKRCVPARHFFAASGDGAMVVARDFVVGVGFGDGMRVGEGVRTNFGVGLGVGL